MNKIRTVSVPQAVCFFEEPLIKSAVAATDPVSQDAAPVLVTPGPVAIGGLKTVFKVPLHGVYRKTGTGLRPLSSVIPEYGVPNESRP